MSSEYPREKDPSLFRQNAESAEHDLPPYTASNSPLSAQRINGLSHIDFTKYHIPDSSLSPDQTTVTIYSADLSSNPGSLENFLKEQILLPPRPTVRIVGSIQGHQLLFDVKFDLLRHISPSAEEDGSWAYTKVEGMDDSASPIKPDEKAALMSGGFGPDVTGAGFWLRRFCGDSAPVKKFIFKRSVINWDTEYLAQELRKLIHSAGFRGPLNIQFPVHRSIIVVQSPHQVNSLVTTLRSAFLAPKKYEVLSVIWPYANHPRNVEEHVKGSRKCMLQAEDDWLAEWGEAIKFAMSSRRHGWLSESDKIDVAMSAPPKQTKPAPK